MINKVEKTQISEVQVDSRYHDLIMVEQQTMIKRRRMEWAIEDVSECRCVAEEVACGFMKAAVDEDLMQLEFDF